MTCNTNFMPLLKMCFVSHLYEINLAISTQGEISNIRHQSLTKRQRVEMYQDEKLKTTRKNGQTSVFP